MPIECLVARNRRTQIVFKHIGALSAVGARMHDLEKPSSRSAAASQMQNTSLSLPAT
jgi:uncharacterized membrane protein YjjP (DUF1212 family)